MIINAGPTVIHYDANLKSMQKKKYLFTEKPGSLRLGELKRLKEEGIMNLNENILSGVNFQRKYHSDYERMKRHIESGDIGRTEMINIVSRDLNEPSLQYL